MRKLLVKGTRDPDKLAQNKKGPLVGSVRRGWRIVPEDMMQAPCKEKA